MFGPDPLNIGNLLPGHFALTALFILFLLRVYNQYHDYNNYTTSKHTLTLLGKYSFPQAVSGPVQQWIFLSTAELAAGMELATPDPPASLQGVACTLPNS